MFSFLCFISSKMLVLGHSGGREEGNEKKNNLDKTGRTNNSYSSSSSNFKFKSALFATLHFQDTHLKEEDVNKYKILKY